MNSQASSEVRLKWACRRGMLELDLILLQFFENQFKLLSSSEQSLFEELLGCADQDLYAWLLAFKPCLEPRFQPLLSKIRSYVEHHSAS